MLDLGDGLAVAFKVESHNHPSAVEPFQGAATGVGGILRDIIAMGARPIALLDGLRFGAPDDHFSRAVGGIGAYGNSRRRAERRRRGRVRRRLRVELPRQRDVRRAASGRRLMSAKAPTGRRALVLYGATTGRDGIGGASVLASQELGEDDRGQAPVRAGRRPLHRQASDRGVGRARRARARALAPGLRRGRARLVALGDGGRLRHRRPPRPRAAARGGHGAVGGHDLRVAGADGRDRRPRAARRGRGRDRPLGAPPRRDRRGDRRPG